MNFVSSSKFEKMRLAATIKNNELSDRVVIHAAKKGDKLEADVVHLGLTMRQHETRMTRGLIKETQLSYSTHAATALRGVVGSDINLSRWTSYGEWFGAQPHAT